MAEEFSILERITASYYRLTNSEKKVADFVSSHRNETQKMSISDLADASGVAEATISRFSKKLGYENFNAMKIALAQSFGHDTSQEISMLTGNIREEDSIEEIAVKLMAADTMAMRQTLEVVVTENYKKAVDLLEQADQVLCMGQGGSMIIAEEAAHLFSTIDRKYFAVADAHSQTILTANASRKDVLLYFSYSGGTKDLIHTLEIAKKTGMESILVTRFPNSPGAQLAGLVLQYGANENALQIGSVAGRVSQLYLIDILFSEMCRRNMSACHEARERIADALKEKFV